MISLNIPFQKECDRITIFDNSVLDDPYSHSYTLEVKPPLGDFVNISLSQNWCSSTLTALDLEMNCEGNLPDRVYEIKYKVDSEEVLYYHFRVCKLWNKYVKKLCDLDCDKVEELYEIRNIILDAVIMAEDCHKPEKALEMYEYAEKKLDNDCMC